MKKTIIALLLALTGWGAWAQEAPQAPAGGFASEARNILVRSAERCRSVRGGRYEMDVATKFITQPDTVRTHVVCHFVRVSDDTLFGQHFLHTSLRDGKRLYALYAGNELIRCNDSSGTVYPLSYCADYMSVIENRHPFFLPLSDGRCRPISGMLDLGSRADFCLRDTLLDGRPCHWIACADTRVDTDAVLGAVATRHEVTVWIDRRDDMPVRFDERLDRTEASGTTSQYWSYVLRSFAPEADAALLTKEALPPGVRLKDYDKAKSRTKPLAAGAQAPDWALATAAGDSVRLSGLRGRVVLLDFFFKSCVPCIEALPWLQRMHEQYGEQGLAVVGIDPYDASQQDAVAAFLSQRGVGYAVLFADRKVAKAYGVSSFPTLFLIDREGRIACVREGCTGEMEEEMERQLKALLQ